MVRTRNKNFRAQLLDRLSENGWQIVDRNTDVGWWAECQWRICSTKHAPELELILTFLIDPAYDGLDRAGAVWAVTASRRPLQDRMDCSSKIAEMMKGKGRVSEEVQLLVEQVNAYRDQQHGLN